MYANTRYLVFSFLTYLYGNLSVHPHLYKWPSFVPFYVHAPYLLSSKLISVGAYGCSTGLSLFLLRSKVNQLHACMPPLFLEFPPCLLCCIFRYLSMGMWMASGSWLLKSALRGALGCMRLSDGGFLWPYTQEWDCRVVRQSHS